jgi:hypothetical protein
MMVYPQTVTNAISSIISILEPMGMLEPVAKRQN